MFVRKRRRIVILAYLIHDYIIDAWRAGRNTESRVIHGRRLGGNRSALLFLGMIVEPQGFQRIEAESRRKVAVIINDNIIPVPCEESSAYIPRRAHLGTGKWKIGTVIFCFRSQVNLPNMTGSSPHALRKERYSGDAETISTAAFASDI